MEDGRIYDRNQLQGSGNTTRYSLGAKNNSTMSAMNLRIIDADEIS